LRKKPDIAVEVSTRDEEVGLLALLNHALGQFRRKPRCPLSAESLREWPTRRCAHPFRLRGI